MATPGEGTWNQVLAEDAARSIDRMTATRAPAASEERVAIVAYLRRLAREGSDVLAAMTEHDKRVGDVNIEKVSSVASAYARMADLIEEGAHHAD